MVSNFIRFSGGKEGGTSMKSVNKARIILCVVIFAVLIVSAFVGLDQKATGNGTVIGNFANGSTATEVAGSAESSIESFSDFIVFVKDNVAWGIFMCILLVGTGFYISIRTGFFQVARFGHVMKNTVGKLFAKKEKKTQEKGELTPWQAMCTAIAGTVGTGNIAGVAGAIVIGGPGAVFWMWVAALVGMVTKYAEIVLAVHFREKNADGEWLGGPMYYIKNGLGKGWGWLASLFALFGAVAAFGIGSMTQINTIAGSLITAVDSVTATAIAGSELEYNIRLAIGFGIAVLLSVVMFGGVSRIGKVTEKIVPIMSVFYVLFALVVVVANIGNIGMAFGSIFRAAFCGEAVIGGVGGFVFMTALKKGVGRGVFSNEAGLGSAPIAHSTTSETDPVKQGLYGIFEVFLDTFVICTLTALVLLCANVVPWGDASLAGADATIMAFGAVFGKGAASIFIAIAILFFAFSTILSWSLYGSRCWGYLSKNRGVQVYQVVYILTAAVGAIAEVSLVWDIADMLNGFMAVPNLIAVLALSGVVVKLTKDYKAKLKK